MRSRFPGFATVRAVCYGCGWYRILGYTGANGSTRGLIRVERARSACNVLWAKVVTVGAERDLSQLQYEYPHYRDLEHAWSWERPVRDSIDAKRPYWALVRGQPCPRCKRLGGVYLDVYRELSHGSTHVSCWVPPNEAPSPARANYEK